MANRRKARRKLADYRFLIFAWGLLAFYRLSLAVAPYRVVKSALPSTPSTTAPGWAIARTRWAVGSAAPLAFGATCLPQAMAANALLALQGYGSVIRIGVRRKEDESVQAHAWVVANDRVVIGDDGEALDSFSPLVDLGRHS